jgi:hypothetical protein
MKQHVFKKKKLYDSIIHGILKKWGILLQQLSHGILVF